MLKGAYSNTGDEVFMRDGVSVARWRTLAREVGRHPDRWVAQRRFEPVPLASAMGPVFPCIGVYVIDGAAAGAYVRLATERIVDYRAMDAALLIVEDVGW